MLSFDARLAEAGAVERDALHELLTQRPPTFRRIGRPLIGLAVIILAGWAALTSDGVRDYFPDHETRKGEIIPVAFADGSELTLDTDGAVRVSFDRM